MVRDFTLSKYRELLECLEKNGYEFCRVVDHLRGDEKIPYVILRHDVDRQKRNALKMARLEEDLGVNSSYYFRYPKTFDRDLIEGISDLGHEIGYHYEAFSKAEGDVDKALKIFSEELQKFREIFKVKTICMHGAPLSDVDNQDLVEYLDFNKFDLEGDAIDSVNSDVIYFTDTGRRWDEKFNVRDKVGEKEEKRELKSTDELIEAIEEESFDKLYINAHPERWNENVVMWTYKYLLDVAFNYGKKVLSD